MDQTTDSPASIPVEASAESSSDTASPQLLTPASFAEDSSAAAQNGSDVNAESAESTDSLREQPTVRDPDRFTGHKVRLHIFEGPLDLLLYLIRAHRYDVCDIPIQAVTNQFLEFLRLMEEVDLEYAGDFMVTAATLMQIKSRMLLPPQESANEEEMEETGIDPRQELVERLLEYQKFQEAAETLKGMRDERAQMFTRLVPLDDSLADTDGADDNGVLLLQDISTFDLLRALQKVLERVAERPVATIRREPFTIGERIRQLLGRITATREGSTFDALCEDCETRLEVVITFLALLELIRRGRAIVSQPEPFAEIVVRRYEAESST
ncbi:MAG: segregation/condensation protein A [Abitibacteriaceae bacterium]|nr:segregation/condensation protein A [Abditibacteriaceae bacterium]MBV9864513.1 segregation/condensation protein A [Abditibacteriaceae bacterium]